MHEHLVYIINNCLNAYEIECLVEECIQSSNTTNLSDLGASVDLFEGSIIEESSRIRYDSEKFFSERWRHVKTTSECQTNVKNLLLTKLPHVVSKLSSSSGLYLFNEHYVVKHVDSALEFRWHTDANEQLPTMSYQSRPEYWSVWCPLQDVTPLNGTLAFPGDATILCCDYADLDAISVSSDVHSPLSLACPAEDDEGVELTIPAGSVVVFGSAMYHRSGPNLSDSHRLVYYAQYSSQVITSNGSKTVGSGSISSSTSPLCYAIPCQI